MPAVLPFLVMHGGYSYAAFLLAPNRRFLAIGGAGGDAFGLVPVFLVMAACAVASLAFALAVAHYEGRD